MCDFEESRVMRKIDTNGIMSDFYKVINIPPNCIVNRLEEDDDNELCCRCGYVLGYFYKNKNYYYFSINDGVKKTPHSKFDICR